MFKRLYNFLFGESVAERTYQDIITRGPSQTIIIYGNGEVEVINSCPEPVKASLGATCIDNGGCMRTAPALHHNVTVDND